MARMGTWTIPNHPNPVDEVWTNPPQFLCIYLSKKRLLPNANSVKDLKTSTAAPSDASWYRLIMPTISVLVNSSKYGMEGSPDEGELTFNTNDGTGMGRSAITRQFVEVLKGKNGTSNVGYRFWIINQCPDKDLNKALVDLLKENGEDTKKDRKSNSKANEMRVGEDYKELINQHVYTTNCDIYDHSNTEVGCVSLSQLEDPTCVYSMTHVFGLHNAFKLVDTEDTNSIQSNLHSYSTTNTHGESTLRFPKPCLVREIPSQLFTPQFVLNLEFPKTCSLNEDYWPEVNIDVVKYERRKIIMKSSAPQTVLGTIDETISEIQSMAEQNTEEWKNIEKTVSTMEDPIGTVKQWRERKINEFQDLWGTARHVSEPLLAMFKWHEHNVMKAVNDQLPHLSYSRPEDHCLPIDKTLSIFGNYFVRRMNWLKNPYKCSTSHMIVMFMSFARLDAYRRGLDLHQNWVLTGSGNTGKSYATDIIGKDMSIPNTVEYLSHETAKANAISHNQNDRITLMHEFPDHLLGIGKGQMANTGDYMFKNSLDSSVVHTKAFHRDEITGERTAKYMESETIRVVGGCTNEPPKQIPEALMQRFIVMMIAEYDCPDGRKADHFFDERQKCEDNTYKDQVNHFHCVEQYLYCIVEKLIWCKVLPDVEDTICLSTLRDIEYYLAPKGIDMTLTRNLDRVKKLARTMTIIHAIEHVFHTPSSRHYGKRFQISMMLDCIPFLIITEEISIAAVQMMEEQFHTSGEDVIVKDLTKSVCLYPPPPDYDGFDPNAMDGDVPDPKWRLITDAIGNKYADYNYVELEGTMWDIAAQARRCATRTKHSVANINMILWRLSNRKIKARKYIGWKQQDNKFVDMPIFEKSQKSNDKRYYVNVHYIDQLLGGKFDDVFKEAVLNTTTTITRPRKIICGKSFIDYIDEGSGKEHTIPDVLRTIELQRHHTRVKAVRQLTKVDGEDLFFEYDEDGYDFESIKVLEFMNNNYVFNSEDRSQYIDIEGYLPEIYEERYREFWSAHQDTNYPQDYIENRFKKRTGRKMVWKKRRAAGGISDEPVAVRMRIVE